MPVKSLEASREDDATPVLILRDEEKKEIARLVMSGTILEDGAKFAFSLKWVTSTTYQETVVDKTWNINDIQIR
jgi:hypothetical protein